MKKRYFIFLIFIFALVWLYTNSLIGVDQKAKEHLKELRRTLVVEGHRARFFVISGRRWKWDNWILRKVGGAASKSQHLNGKAIDIIVLDVYGDGKRDRKDVDIVFKILDQEIIKNQGGLGTYKKEEGFFNRQMIHFDVRGEKARWNR